MVELTLPEVLAAATVGMNRHVAALKRKLPDRHGRGGLGWNDHVEGACGEMAVAKALGVFWSASLNTFKSGGDIGNRIQVRTRSKDYYELIVRDDDDPDHIFILATGLSPVFKIHGWILGRDARRDEWRQTHGGREAAWFVPQSSLSDISTLKQSQTVAA